MLIWFSIKCVAISQLKTAFTVKYFSNNVKSLLSLLNIYCIYIFFFTLNMFIQLSKFKIVKSVGLLLLLLYCMHLLLFLHPVLWSHRLFNNFILSDPVCPHQLFSESLRAGGWLFALGCTLSTELIKAVVPKWEWYQNLNASIGLAGPWGAPLSPEPPLPSNPTESHLAPSLAAIRLTVLPSLRIPCSPSAHLH